MRWFWRIYWPMAVGLLLLVPAATYAGRIEARIAPVLVNIRVVPGSIDRSGHRLCYAWTSDKLRAVPLENVDVFLDQPRTGDRTWPEVKDRATGRAWHRQGAYPVRPDNLHQQCVDVPDDVDPADPLLLHQTLLFGGWGGWYVPVTMPDISIAGTPA